MMLWTPLASSQTASNLFIYLFFKPNRNFLNFPNKTGCEAVEVGLEGSKQDGKCGWTKRMKGWGWAVGQNEAHPTGVSWIEGQ